MDGRTPEDTEPGVVGLTDCETDGREYDRRSGARSAYQVLVLAILEEALQCLAGKGVPVDPDARRNRRPAQLQYALEAREWLLSDDIRWPFSFVNVCDRLGFDASAVRQWLFSLSRAQLRAMLGRLSRRKISEGMRKHRGVRRVKGAA